MLPLIEAVNVGKRFADDRDDGRPFGMDRQ
jgi:hypothetical protein